MNTEPLPDLAFLRRLAAVAAAETLPLFRRAAPVENKVDAGFDPVTEADRRAETALVTAIEAQYPHHGIIGEEHGTARADAETVWIIDPVDGTRAFISGLPVWGTLVGLKVGDRARAGFMSQPFTGELFAADGKQSWFMRNDGEPEPIATRRGHALDQATLFTTTPALYAGEKREAYDRLESAVRLPRYGCDCYAFAMLAAGHADIVVEPGLQTYDIAALIPVVEQAGGVVTTWSGGNAVGGGDVIAAATPELHASALRILSGS